MAVLDLNRVTVRHAELPALADVTMAVEAQEIVGVMGPPGAGKSTLTQTLTGVRPPDKGTITVRGRDVTKASGEYRNEAGLGWTVDSSILVSIVTVREHLHPVFNRGSWAGTARRLIGGGADRDMHRVLDALALSPHADRQLGTLPLALRRRFELAQALAHEPAVIVADGLGMGLKDDEVREFARMCRAVRGMRGVAMFVTDRSPEFILEVSDYVYVLDGGRVIARGDPDSMRGRKEVAAAFSRRSRTLGEPTLLPAERTERLAPVDPAPPAPTATSRAARLEAALAHFQFHRDRLRGQRNTQRSDE